MNRLSYVAVLGAVAAASSTLAFATPITPGQTVTAAPVTVAPTSLVASISGTVASGVWTGDYSEYIIHDSSNPFNADCGASGCLTFVLEVSDKAGSVNGMEHVSNGDGGPPFGSLAPGEGFENYQLNVGYVVGPYSMGTDVPGTVDESNYGTVEFNFTGADAIAPGTGTEYLVIQTSASNYTSGNFSVIDSDTDTVQGFVPAAATPEPSSMILLGSGLVGLAGAVRRRFV